MEIPYREQGDVVIIELTGKVDIRLRSAVNDVLEQSFQKKRQLFVCDLSQVEYIDSSGLGILISMIKKVNTHHGTLRLCRANPAIMELLVLSHLVQVFDIYDNLETALKGFAV